MCYTCHVRSPAIPEAIIPLLWDVDLERFSFETHADLLFERVMTRGSWAAMKWLRAHFSRDELAEFLERRGACVLTPRDLAYWSLICELDVPIPPGGGRPSWAGP